MIFQPYKNHLLSWNRIRMLAVEKVIKVIKKRKKEIEKFHHQLMKKGNFLIKKKQV